jgi:hypothetical protein
MAGGRQIEALMRKDMVAGLMFVAIGFAFAYGASSYRMGVVSSMGPGYFPFWLGILLACLLRLHRLPTLHADRRPARHRRRRDDLDAPAFHLWRRAARTG